MKRILALALLTLALAVSALPQAAPAPKKPHCGVKCQVWKVARWPVAAGIKAVLLLTNTTAEGEDAAGTQKGTKRK